MTIEKLNESHLNTYGMTLEEGRPNAPRGLGRHKGLA